MFLSCTAYPVSCSRRRRRRLLHRGGGVVVGGDSATFSCTAPGRGVRRPPRCPPSRCGRYNGGVVGAFRSRSRRPFTLSVTIHPSNHQSPTTFSVTFCPLPPSHRTGSAHAVCAASAVTVVSENGVGVSATTPARPCPTTMIFPTRSQVFYFVVLLSPLTTHTHTHTHYSYIHTYDIMYMCFVLGLNM